MTTYKQYAEETSPTRITEQGHIRAKWKHTLQRNRKVWTCMICNLKFRKYDWGWGVTMRVNSKRPDSEYRKQTVYLQRKGKKTKNSQ